MFNTNHYEDKKLNLPFPHLPLPVFSPMAGGANPSLPTTARPMLPVPVPGNPTGAGMTVVLPVPVKPTISTSAQLPCLPNPHQTSQLTVRAPTGE